MAFNGLKSDKMRSWPLVSRNSSALTLSGSLSKTITKNTLYRCLQLMASTFTSNTRYPIQLLGICLPSFRNYKTFPKSNGMREWLPYFWRNATFCLDCWVLSVGWRRQAKPKNYRSSSTSSRSCLTQAMKSFTTNCCVISLFRVYLAFFNVLKMLWRRS